MMIWSGFTVHPDNIPQPRPGMYTITNLVNGKVYVGISYNVRRRLMDHSKIGYKGRLPNALKKYGLKNFLASPVFYNFNGTEGLEEAEADMIALLNSIQHGYNTIAAYGGVGPYGPAFAEAHRLNWQKPGNYDRFLAAMAVGRSTPEGKANHSAASTEVRNRPEIKQAHGERISQLVWITDGVRSKRVEASEPLEDGWRYGRNKAPFLTEEYKAGQRANVQRAWADEEFRERERERRIESWEKRDDAARDRHAASISASKLTPEGRAKNVAMLRNLVWITDGKTSSRVAKETSIPDGWRLGRTSKARTDPGPIYLDVAD